MVRGNVAPGCWLPKCNDLRIVLPNTYKTKPLFYRLKLPYFIQLDDKFQTITFDAKPSGLGDERIVSKRQLRDCIRAERKFNGKANIVDKAKAYAEVVNRNPQMTKSQIAEQLGFSRIHLYRILNLLNLAPEIINFIQLHNSPAYREIFTERRLRKLCLIKKDDEQLCQFRDIILVVN